MADEFAGWSPYSYAFNNPLIYSDPTGMAPVCEQEENCDDTYEVDAIVENRLGSWQYLGDNQWETLSLAEGVDQIQSGLGYALHRLGSTFSTEYHDFGSRTLAEETMMNVSNRAPSLEILGGMRVLAFRGAGHLSSLFRAKSAVKESTKLLDTARSNLLNTVQNPKLRNIVNDLYRPGAKVGRGSSMDAFRMERLTGGTLDGKSHHAKLLNYRTALQRLWSNRANLSHTDRQIVKQLLQDIQNALSGY